jgi:hypothetical protein
MPTPRAGYRLPDGTRIPGTTTVISRFKDSGGLMHWAFAQGKAGAPSLYSEAEKAADIGTLAHEMVEAHINGAPPDGVLEGIDREMAGKARNAFDQYLTWESQTRIELLSHYQELQLVSEEHRFGGTPDAIGQTPDGIVLLDWKSSNAVYSDYLIQLAAYGHLLEHGRRMDTGEYLKLKPRAFFLLRFSKDFPDFEFRRFGALDSAWRQFLLFREAYDIDRELKKRAA